MTVRIEGGGHGSSKMTDLTPNDVRREKKRFRRAFRGYDTKAVDEFLEQLAERLEELGGQNADSTARTEELQDQLSAYRAREGAINKAMVAAQQLEVDAQVRMEQEAKVVHAEARREVQRILDEVQRIAQHLRRALKGLAQQKMEFVKTFRALLQKHMVEVDTYDEELTVSSHATAEAPPSPAVDRPSDEATAKPVEATNGDHVSAWLSSILGKDEHQHR